MMPHVLIKLNPGRSEDQKTLLTAEIVRDVMHILNCTDQSVSVAFEEVSSSNWREQVYQPDILAKPKTLYKKPGYQM